MIDRTSMAVAESCEPEQATADAERVVTRVNQVLGPPATWRPAPSEYPDGLALAVIDAIWSIGVRYGAVEKVVDAYRRGRRAEGGEPDRDGLPELLDHYHRIGGPEQFAIRVQNLQRVSTHPGAIRKSEAVHRAALGLTAVGVDTSAQLRASLAATGLPDSSAKKAWLAVPGQRSGISWRYLLMLVGVPNVKPDRWVCRFVAQALGRDVFAPDRAACLVERAAEHIGVSTTLLDHEIWRYERARPPRTRN